MKNVVNHGNRSTSVEKQKISHRDLQKELHKYEIILHPGVHASMHNASTFI